MAADLERMAQNFEDRGFPLIAEGIRLNAKIARQQGAPETFSNGTPEVQDEKNIRSIGVGPYNEAQVLQRVLNANGFSTGILVTDSAADFIEARTHIVYIKEGSGPTQDEWTRLEQVYNKALALTESQNQRK